MTLEGSGHGDASLLFRVLHYVVFCSAGDREPASSATRRVSWSRSSGTLKKASWRARARQVPFLRPLWGGLNTRTRPTRAAYTRARVIQGASEPTTNIACRAYSCTARRRCSPTKATKWREASRAVREARLASHDCRGPTPPQPRNTSRAMHANAVAP